MSQTDSRNNVGNIKDSYKHEPRIIVPIGTVEDSSLVLKTYSMFRGPETRKTLGPPGRLAVERFRPFLASEIKRGNIESLSGLGFTILSEDMLNVARWDTEYPIVLRNQIYSFEDGDLETAKPLDIREVGSFCIWELEIVGHERNAWERYLSSGRTAGDKDKYLEDFFTSKMRV